MATAVATPPNPNPVPDPRERIIAEYRKKIQEHQDYEARLKQGMVFKCQLLLLNFIRLLRIAHFLA